MRTLLAFLAFAELSIQAVPKPNVMFIIVDDLRPAGRHSDQHHRTAAK